MFRSLLPAGVSLRSDCSGSIAGDHVEALTLIANELVTNAAKYAFQERDSGEIALSYREEGAGWRLSVHDNGRGLPPGHDNGGRKSFGHQLVATLVARVNAQISYVSKDGTQVDVTSGVT
jgi:two-component sensor histidine kinase